MPLIWVVIWVARVAVCRSTTPAAVPGRIGIRAPVTAPTLNRTPLAVPSLNRTALAVPSLHRTALAVPSLNRTTVSVLR